MFQQRSNSCGNNLLIEQLVVTGLTLTIYNNGNLVMMAIFVREQHLAHVQRLFALSEITPELVHVTSMHILIQVQPTSS